MPSIADLGNRLSKMERTPTIVSNATIGGTLDVAGVTTLAGATTITGATTIVGALTHDVDLGTTWGAGLPGTGVAPKAYRRTENGVIITTYKIDLTGLSVKGGNADDVIGKGTVPAYIDRVVTSTHGIIFKIEMSCIEVGAAASGTITNWIDLTGNSAGTIDFDEAASTDQVLDAVDAWVAGETVVNNKPTVTANDWLYLTEGNTAATDGVYSSGQFIITLYGHPILA